MIDEAQEGFASCPAGNLQLKRALCVPDEESEFFFYINVSACF
jgi:hypothetical protein